MGQNGTLVCSHAAVSAVQWPFEAVFHIALASCGDLQSIYIYIYISIYTRVNPCISVHEAENNRTMCSLGIVTRAQRFRIRSLFSRFFTRVRSSSDVEHFECPGEAERVRPANLNAPAKPRMLEQHFRPSDAEQV